MKVPVRWPSLTLDPRAPGAFVQALLAMFQRIGGAINNPDFGTTAARPTEQLVIGQTYFDTDLGVPIWWLDPDWVDATGAPV